MSHPEDNVTTTTIQPSAAARIIEVSQAIANLTAERARAVEALEDGLAAGRDVDGLPKTIERITAQIEGAMHHRAGLEKLLVPEQRAALVASLAEAEGMQREADAAFNGAIAELDHALREYGRLEVEATRLRVERDNSYTRVFRRRDTLTKFIAENGDALARADRLAGAEAVPA